MLIVVMMVSGLMIVRVDSYTIHIIWLIFMFLQCVSTVIIVYVIISPLSSYLYVHWILDFKYILLLLLLLSCPRCPIV